MSDDNKISILEVGLIFLMGAAAGIVAGILLAPASGKKTRKKILGEIGKTGEKAKDGFEKIAKEAEKGIHGAREKAQEGIDSVKEFIGKKKR
jgi:gas vesicle protein